MLFCKSIPLSIYFIPVIKRTVVLNFFIFEYLLLLCSISISCSKSSSSKRLNWVFIHFFTRFLLSFIYYIIFLCTIQLEEQTFHSSLIICAFLFRESLLLCALSAIRNKQPPPDFLSSAKSVILSVFLTLPSSPLTPVLMLLSVNLANIKPLPARWASVALLTLEKLFFKPLLSLLSTILFFLRSIKRNVPKANIT